MKTTFQDVYLNISVHKSFGLSFTNISAFVISLARSQYLANQLLFSPRVVTSYLCVLPNEKIRPGKESNQTKFRMQCTILLDLPGIITRICKMQIVPRHSRNLYVCKNKSLGISLKSQQSFSSQIQSKF